MNYISRLLTTTSSSSSSSSCCCCRRRLISCWRLVRSHVENTQTLALVQLNTGYYNEYSVYRFTLSVPKYTEGEEGSTIE